MFSKPVLPEWPALPTRIPQELIDRIVDFVEPWWLKATSLISRSWLVSTRRHIFRRIIADSREHGRSLADLVEMLRHSSWDFRWTTHLQVHDKIPFTDLLFVIERLDRLRSLRFRAARISEIPDVLPSLAPPVRSIKNITFSDTTVLDHRTPWEIKIYIAHIFSFVEELCIECGLSHADLFHRWKEEDTDDMPRQAISFPRQCRLTSTLILSKYGYELPFAPLSIVDTLLQSFDLRSLSTFSFPLFPLACCAGYTSLVQAVANTLTFITLDLRYPPEGETQDERCRTIWAGLRLSLCTSLQHVRLVFRSHTNNADIWHRALDVLSFLPPTSRLSSVTFQMSFSFRPFTASTLIELLPWARMQDVLLGCNVAGNVIFAIDWWETATRAGFTRDITLQRLSRLAESCPIDFDEFKGDWCLE